MILEARRNLDFLDFATGNIESGRFCPPWNTDYHSLFPCSSPFILCGGSREGLGPVLQKTMAVAIVTPQDDSRLTLHVRLLTISRTLLGEKILFALDPLVHIRICRMNRVTVSHDNQIGISSMKGEWSA